jgi:hypothetical protein
MALILGLLAFGIGRVAPAAEQDVLVNSQIKEEFIRMDVQQRRANLEFRRPAQEPLTDAANAPQPLNENDPLLREITPLGPGEQAGAIERPQGGVSVKSEMGDSLQRDLVEKQAYELYRSHYRAAVQSEFLRRLQQAGYNGDQRNVAEEIKHFEETSPRN